MGFQFLKKSPLRLSLDGAECSMRLIAELEGEMGEAIKEEAALIYEKANHLWPELKTAKKLSLRPIGRP
jgi:hypothetical protein